MNSFFVNSWGKSSNGFGFIILMRPFIKGNKLLNVQVFTYFYRYKVFIISSKGSYKIQALFQPHFQSKYFLSTTNVWMTSQMKNSISRSDREWHLESNCISPSYFMDQKYGGKKKSGKFVEKTFQVSFVVP